MVFHSEASSAVYFSDLVVEGSGKLKAVWVVKVLLETWKVSHALEVGSKGWELGLHGSFKTAVDHMEQLEEVEVDPGWVGLVGYVDDHN